jgi:hypothetical protein
MTDTQTAPEAGWLTRLWRGEYSLPVTLWGFGFLGLSLLGTPWALFRVATASQDSANSWAFGLGTMVVTQMYKVLICVAVWRSAERAINTATVWKLGAKALTVVWLLSPIAQPWLAKWWGVG